jgi:alanyl-tRNA synthetase
MPPTRLLFYESPYTKEFDATVVGVIRGWVALDQTCFFAEGGGQPADKGKIVCNGKEYEVADTQRIKEVILHKVPGLRVGDRVHGIVDWDRRSALMRMHTGTHVIAGSARKVVGKHVWQAGAQKGLKTSRIDLTHYSAFTDRELAEIEKLANETIKKNVPVTAQFIPRGEAERSYGFVLYQGGASPGRQVRVVNVGSGFDVEACAGTHLKSTGEVGEIRIVKSERIQDGVNRLEFACGAAAAEFGEKERKIFDEARHAMSGISKKFKHLSGGIEDKNVSAAIANAASELSVEPLMLGQTIAKFSRELEANNEEMERLCKLLKTKAASVDSLIGDAKPKTLGQLAALLFAVWKKQSKLIEDVRSKAAGNQAASLLAKEKDGTVFEAVPFGRKEMIATAEAVLAKKADVTVILVNKQGEVVVMSGTQDAGRIARELCKKAGGSGGGSERMGQGRADFEKLVG